MTAAALAVLLPAAAPAAAELPGEEHLPCGHGAGGNMWFGGGGGLCDSWTGCDFWLVLWMGGYAYSVAVGREARCASP